MTSIMRSFHTSPSRHSRRDRSHRTVDRRRRDLALLFETLEERRLLASDLTFDASGLAGLNARLEVAEENIRIVDVGSGSVLASQTLQDTSAVVVTGSPNADTLTIDDSFLSGISVRFDAAGGIDVLVGPSNVDPWTITADNQGTLGGKWTFSNVESLDAKSQNSLLDYSRFETGVTVDFSTGSATGFETIKGFRSVLGSEFADSFKGSNVDSEYFSGGLGADTFDAPMGIIVEARDANFVLSTDDQSGVHTLDISGDAIDTITNISHVQLIGGESDNIIDASEAIVVVTLDGGEGDDTLKGGSDDATLIGGPGFDTIDGGGFGTLVESVSGRAILTDELLDLGEGSNERVAIVLGATTTGTFQLTYDGQTTIPIAHDASALQVQAALSALPNIGIGNVSVTGSETNAGEWDVEFTGRLGGMDVSDLDIENIGLGGPVETFSVADGTVGGDALSRISAVELTGGVADNFFDTSAFSGEATVRGGAGNNTFVAGGRRHNLIGGDGLKDLIIASADGYLKLEKDILRRSETGSDFDNFSGIEFARLTGGDNGNTFDAADFIGSHPSLDVFAPSRFGVEFVGGSGADNFTGSRGFDTFNLLEGDDTVNGGDGTDTLIETADANMTLTDTQFIVDGEGTNTIASIESAKLIGGGSANVLDASGFTLGPVTLDGGGGADTLTGGAGGGTFIGDPSGLDPAKSIGITLVPAATNETIIRAARTVSQSQVDQVNIFPAAAITNVVLQSSEVLDVGSVNTGGRNLVVKAPWINVNNATLTTTGATGNGDLSLSGQHITIGGGSQLTTVGTGADGKIDIIATDRGNFDGPVITNVDFVKASVTIDQATIRGGDVTIRSSTDGQRTLNPSDFKQYKFGEKLATKLNGVVSGIEDKAFLAGVSVLDATASINIGQQATIESAEFVAFSAVTGSVNSAPGTLPEGPSVAAAVGVLTTNARLVFAGDLTATGNATIGSAVDNTVSVASSTQDAAIAVSVLDSSSELTVSDTSDLIVGGNLTVQSNTTDRNATAATTKPNEDGIAEPSQAAASISVENGNTWAYLDGRADVAGTIAVSADQVKTSIAGTGNSGVKATTAFDKSSPDLVTGFQETVKDGLLERAGVKQKLKQMEDTQTGFTNAVKKAVIENLPVLPGSVAKSIREKLTSESTTVSEPKDLIGAALAVVVDNNNVAARIGDGNAQMPAEAADVEADGDITVTATINNRPIITVASNVENTKVKDSTDPNADPKTVESETGSAFAIAIGVYNNDSDAWIGGDASVDTKKKLKVEAKTLNDVDPEKLKGGFVAPTVASASFKSDSGTQMVANGNTVDVVDGHQAGGSVGVRYKYIDGPTVQIDLSKEDFTNTSRWSKLGNPTKNAAEKFVARFATQLSGDLGADSNVVDTWTQATAQGQVDAKAAAVTVLVVDQAADATIKGGAKINQDPQLASGTQDVVVQSLNVNETVNLTGNVTLPGLNGANTAEEWKLDNIATTGGLGNSTRPGTGGSAIGAATMVAIFDNHSNAIIEDGVVLKADSLEVDAETHALLFGLGAAGGETDSNAFNGTFFVNVIENHTKANVGHNATLVIGSGKVTESTAAGDPVTRPESLLIEATDKTNAILVTGGVSVSGNIGVGATVGINFVGRTTEASLGNLNGFDSKPVVVGGNLGVYSTNEGFIGGLAVSGSKVGGSASAPSTGVTNSVNSGGASVSNPTNLSTATGGSMGSILTSAQSAVGNTGGGGAVGGQGSAGVGISGSVVVNHTDSSSRALVQSLASLNVGTNDIDVIAKDDSFVGSISGGAAFVSNTANSTGTGKAIAGAAAVNLVSGITEAYIVQVPTIQSGKLNIDANRNGDIVSFTAGLAGAPGRNDIAIAGSVAISRTENSTNAVLNDVNGHITGNVTVNATDNNNVILVAGSAGFGGKAGIGAAVALTEIDNMVSAGAIVVGDSTTPLIHDGDFRVVSSATGTILSATGSAGLSNQGFAAAGTFSLNVIDTELLASISSSNLSSTNGSVFLNAINDASIYSFAGALAVGKTAGLGAAIALNFLSTTSATTLAMTKVRTGGGVSIEGKETGTSVAIAAGGAGGDTLAFAAGVAVNQSNTTNLVSVNQSDVVVGGPIRVAALEQTLLIGLTGGLAVGTNAVGASIGANLIENRVATTVDASTLQSTTSKVDILSLSETVLVGVGVGGAVGRGLAIAGSISVNKSKNQITSTVKGKSRVEGKGVRVAADDSSSIVVLSFGAAVSSGLAVGASAATTDIENTVHSIVDDATIVSTGTTGAEGIVSITAGYVPPAALDVTTLSTGASGHSIPVPLDKTGGNIQSTGSHVTNVTVAGAGASTFAAGAAINLNWLRNDIQANVVNGSVVEAAQRLDLLASDKPEITSVAVGAAGGANAAVGAAISYNYIGGNPGDPSRSVAADPASTTAGKVRAIVDGSTITAPGQGTNVVATSDPQMINVTVGAAGAATVAVGGSISVNFNRNIVESSVTNSSVSSTGGGLNVDASVTPSMITLAGAGAGAGSVAAGIASATNDMRNDVTAKLEGSTVTTASTTDTLVTAKVKDATTAQLTTLQDRVKPSQGSVDAQIWSFTISGAGAGTAAGAGSLSLNWMRNTIDAHVSGATTNVITTRDLKVLAEDRSQINSLAGSGSGAGAVSVGASIAYNYLGGNPDDPTSTDRNSIQAFVDGVTVNARDVDVLANAVSGIRSGSIAGTGAGTVAIGGSIAMNFLRTTVDAHVGSGAVITTTTPVGETTTGVVDVMATDTSTIKAVSGAGAGAGTVGVGAAAAYNEIQNNVHSYIADSTVTASASVNVEADVTPTIEVIVVGIAGAGAAGVAGSGSGNVMRNDVRAHLHTSTVMAAHNIRVTADSKNKLGAVTGAAAGGTVSVGGSVLVNDLANTTLAYIDDNSVVTAMAAGGTQTARQSRVSGDGLLSFDGKIRGVLVSSRGEFSPADTTSGIGNLTLTGSAGASVGIGANLVVNQINDRTEAYIDDSTVESKGSSGNLSVVNVLAYFVANVQSNSGVAAAGAAAGVAGSIDTTIIGTTTRAWIGDTDGHTPQGGQIGVDQTRVTAPRRAEVFSGTGVTFVVNSAGGGLGQFAGLAGSAASVEVNATTESTIKDSHVSSEVEVNVDAFDVTNLSLLSGALAGGGLAGFGGSVAVGIVNNNTSATIVDSVVTSATDSVDLTAQSVSKVTNRVGTGAAGGIASIAGSVGVLDVSGVTMAAITTTQGNQTRVEGATGVNVKANERVSVTDTIGTLSVAGAAGVGAGVNVISVHRSTIAEIGDNVSVFAPTVVVDADSTKNIQSNVISFAGGLGVGANATASVINVGGLYGMELANLLGTDQLAMLTSKVNSSFGRNNTSGVNQAGTVGQSGGTIHARMLQNNVGSTLNTTAGRTTSITNALASNQIVGTRARVGDSASISTTTLTVDADDSTTIKITSGGVVGGVASIGGSIAMATTSHPTEAVIGNGASITAETVNVTADATANKDVDAFGGAVGVVAAIGAQVAIVEDQTRQRALVGDGTVFNASKELNVVATTNRDLDATVTGAQISGKAAAGAAIARIDVSGGSSGDIKRGTEAKIGSGVAGSLNGAKINVVATDNANLDSDSRAVSAAFVIAGQFNESSVNYDPAVTASITNRALVAEEVVVSATSTPILTADSVGVTISGVNKLSTKTDATSAAQVTASLGGNVTANQLSVLSKTNNTVDANALGASAGLVGINLPTGVAKSSGLVRSFVGDDSKLTVTQTINVIADSTSNLDADTKGISGAVIASQSNNSRTHSDTTTESYLGQNVSIDGQGVLKATKDGFESPLDPQKQYYVTHSPNSFLSFKPSDFVEVVLDNFGTRATKFRVGKDHGLVAGEFVQFEVTPDLTYRNKFYRDIQSASQRFSMQVMLVPGDDEHVFIGDPLNNNPFHFFPDANVAEYKLALLVPFTIGLSEIPIQNNANQPDLIDLSSITGEQYSLVSPIDPTKRNSFSPSDVDLTTNVITTSGHRFTQGEAVKLIPSKGPNVTIRAIGNESHDPDSAAGLGSLAGLQAATSTAFAAGTTRAFIAPSPNNADSDTNNNASIKADRITIDSDHNATIDGSSENVLLAAVGKSDAIFTGLVRTESHATVGTNVSIVTNHLTVDSHNRTSKPKSDSPNAKLGAVAVGQETKASSKTVVNHNSQATIGNNANVVVTGDLTSTFIVNARNQIDAHDSAENNGAAAIQSATAESQLLLGNQLVTAGGNVAPATNGTHPLAAIATIGTGANVTTAGHLLVTSGVDLVSSVAPTVSAASGGGKTKVDGRVVARPHNEVVIAQGAKTQSHGETRFFAGRIADTPSGTKDRLSASVDGDLINASVFASSDAIGIVDIVDANSVRVESDAVVRSGRSANLAAEQTPRMIGLSSAQAKAISPLPGAVTTTESSQSNLSTQTDVKVDGTVEVGTSRIQDLVITAGANAADPPVINSTTLVTTTTYQSVADQLLELRSRFSELVVQYGNDAAAKAAYVNEIALIDRRLAELRLLRTVDVVDDQGNFVTNANGERVTLTYIDEGATNATVTVPPINAQSGTINIESANLTGTGSLLAESGVSVKLRNESPANMRLTSIVIPQDNSGKVLFNQTEVTDNAGVNRANGTSATQAAFANFKTGGTDQRIIEIESTFAGDDQLLPAQVEIVGSPVIENGRVTGTVGIDNQSGTTRIDAAGQVLVRDQLTTGDINVNATEFVLLIVDRDNDNIPDVGFHTGPSPIQTLDEVRKVSETYRTSQQWLPNICGAVNAGVPCSTLEDPLTAALAAQAAAATTSGIVASGRVAISAPFINVNATIISGTTKQTVKLDIPQTTIDDFDQALTNGLGPRFRIDQASSTVASVLADGTKVEVYYNAELKRLEVDQIQTKPGRIELFGRVVNTGSGQLIALDGPGDINIELQTATGSPQLPVVIHGIDATNQASGLVKIVDSNKLGPNNRPIVTQYTRDASGGVQTETFELPDTGSATNITTTNVAAGTTLQYVPLAGAKYHFQTGQSGSTIVDTTSEKSVPSFFGITDLNFLDSLAPDPDDITSQKITLADLNGDGIPDLRPIVLSNRQNSVGEYVDTNLSSVFERQGYGYSFTKTSGLEFDASSVSGDTITLKADFTERNETAVVFDKASGNGTGNLKDGAAYYVIKDPADSKKIRLASTPANARQGISVSPGNLSGTGFKLLLIQKLRNWETSSKFGPFKTKSNYHQQLITEDPFTELHLHTLKADNPIDVILDGKTPGSININTAGSVLVNGNIKSLATTAINSTSGAIESINADAVIVSQDINLTANKNISASGSTPTTLTTDNATPTASTAYTLNYRSRNFQRDGVTVTANDYLTATVTFNQKPTFPSTSEPDAFVLTFVDDSGNGYSLTKDNLQEGSSASLTFDANGSVTGWELKAFRVQDGVTQSLSTLSSNSQQDFIGTDSITDSGTWKVAPAPPVKSAFDFKDGIPLKVDLIGAGNGVLNAVTTDGHINITEINGALRYNTIAAGNGTGSNNTVSIAGKGSIVAVAQPTPFAGGNQDGSAKLQGSVLSLQSELGSIGTDASPLSIAVGQGTADGVIAVSASGIYLSQGLGDLRLLKAHTARNADVKLLVPNGNLLDVNGTADQSNRASTELEQTLSTIDLYKKGQPIIDAVRAFQNRKTSDYHEYWNLRARQLHTPLGIGAGQTLVDGETYYARKVGEDKVRLATSQENLEVGDFLIFDPSSDPRHQLYHPDATETFFVPSSDVDGHEIRIGIGHGIPDGAAVIYRSNVYNPNAGFPVLTAERAAFDAQIRQQQLANVRAQEADESIAADDPRVNAAVDQFFLGIEVLQEQRYHELHKSVGRIGTAGSNLPTDENRYDLTFKYLSTFALPTKITADAVLPDGKSIELGNNAVRHGQKIVFRSRGGDNGNLVDGQTYYAVINPLQPTRVQLSLTPPPAPSINVQGEFIGPVLPIAGTPHGEEVAMTIDIGTLLGPGHQFVIPGSFGDLFTSSNLDTTENTIDVGRLPLQAGQAVRIIGTSSGGVIDPDTTYFVSLIDGEPSKIRLSSNPDDLVGTVIDFADEDFSDEFRIDDAAQFAIDLVDADPETAFLVESETLQKLQGPVSETDQGANIVGGNVTIETAGSIGTDQAAIIINLPTTALTADQRTALQNAQPGDIRYFDAADGLGNEVEQIADAASLVINGVGDIDIESDGELVTMAGGFSMVQHTPAPVGKIVVTESDGATVVGESGTSDTLSVTLETQPTSNVVMRILVGDASEIMVSQTELTFTSDNWNVPQRIDVSGVDDPFVDLNTETGLTFIVVTALSDDRFDGSDLTVMARNQDDDLAAIAIAASDGSTIVSETGGTDTVGISLSAAPETPVTLRIRTADETEFTADVSELSFDSNSWNQAQLVTITGVDDALLDGSAINELIIEVVEGQSDAKFHGLRETMDVVTEDHELLRFEFEANDLVEGQRTTVTIHRDVTNDDSELTVSLVASDPTQLSVPATVVIPVGANSSEFTIQTLRDAPASALRSLNISVTSAGAYQGGIGTFQLNDNPTPLTNPNDVFDVDDNGRVAPLDILLVINELALRDRERLGNRLTSNNNSRSTYYWDVTGDSLVSPLDALRVINQLSATSRGREAAVTAAEAASGEYLVVDSFFEDLSEDEDDFQYRDPDLASLLF